MAEVPAPLIRHVSRKELAQNRYVWIATGVMYAVFALITVGLIMFVSGLSPLRMQVMTVVLAALAIAHLRSEPPAIGTVGNHVVLIALWTVVGVSFWAFQPGGGVALGAMIFVGPLIAVRLQDRRQIIGHVVAAIVFATVVSIVGRVDAPTALAVLLMTLATVVLCYCCVVVLEGAEAQGDELERLVRRDPLTGVGNRRLLDERLADEFRRHERMQRQLSLVALDLNDFKAINDTQGHAAGDELLRDVADALVRAVEPRDTVVRQGGDEFCIVLPETSASQAERSCNAIRAELAAIGVKTGFGIASYPDDAVEPHVLLHVADERLRDSKLPNNRRADDPQDDAAARGGHAEADTTPPRNGAALRDATSDDPTHPGRVAG